MSDRPKTPTWKVYFPNRLNPRAIATVAAGYPDGAARQALHAMFENYPSVRATITEAASKDETLRFEVHNPAGLAGIYSVRPELVLHATAEEVDDDFEFGDLSK